MAFCWREPDTDLYTAGICQRCEAGHSDEKLSEMVQQEVFSDRVARLRSIEEVSDEMEARGLLETIGLDPITGSNVGRAASPLFRLNVGRSDRGGLGSAPTMIARRVLPRHNNIYEQFRWTVTRPSFAPSC
jgi:hypothetical protein